MVSSQRTLTGCAVLADRAGRAWVPWGRRRTLVPDLAVRGPRSASICLPRRPWSTTRVSTTNRAGRRREATTGQRTRSSRARSARGGSADGSRRPGGPRRGAAPVAKAKLTRRQRVVQGRCKYAAVAGVRRRAGAVDDLLPRLPRDHDPGPEHRLPDPDDQRLLRRRQDQARPVRDPEPRVDPAGRHPAGRCRTRWSPPRTAPSGPTRASTPRGSCARRSPTPRATPPRVPRRSPSSTSRSST